MAKRKCVKCGAIIDTETDEFLNTPEGILCVNCANDPIDQMQDDCYGKEDIDQDFM